MCVAMTKFAAFFFKPQIDISAWVKTVCFELCKVLHFKGGFPGDWVPVLKYDGF